VVRVVHGLGHGLDDNAVRAAQQIHFKPANEERQATDSTVVLQHCFSVGVSLLPKVLMRILHLGPVFLCFCWCSSFPCFRRTPHLPPQVLPPTLRDKPEAGFPRLPRLSMNHGYRVIQREHLFLARMRHMRPMVETYLQDLKSDSNGNSEPVKDQYFLGRLDMSDGPEDTSFVGQPGFGHRMINRLTGLYAMHFLPLGFAQMVVLDTDFQKKYYDFTFVRREFLGEVRCLVIMFSLKRARRPDAFRDGFGLRTRTTTWFASTAPTIPIQDQLLPALSTAGGSTCAPAPGCRLIFTAKNRT